MISCSLQFTFLVPAADEESRSRTGRKGAYAHYYLQIAPNNSFVGKSKYLLHVICNAVSMSALVGMRCGLRSGLLAFDQCRSLGPRDALLIPPCGQSTQCSSSSQAVRLHYHRYGVDRSSNLDVECHRCARRRRRRRRNRAPPTLQGRLWTICPAQSSFSSIYICSLLARCSSILVSRALDFQVQHEDEESCFGCHPVFEGWGCDE